MKNCQDPEFSKRLCIDYFFERVQKLKLGIYDIDNKSVDLKDDDYLGGFECTLGQVSAISHATCCEDLSLFTFQHPRIEVHLLLVQRCEMIACVCKSVWWNVCICMC